MEKQGGKLLVLIFCVPALFSCVSRSKYLASLNEVKNLDEVIGDLREKNSAYSQKYEDMKRRTEMAELELERVKAKAEMQRENYDELYEKFKKIQEQVGELPTGVSMFQAPEGYGFRVEGELLFPSGKFALKKEGEETLLRVAEKLKGGEEKIRIEGHTDSDPVVVHKNELPKGNLQLSVLRSLEVGYFLITRGNIAAERVSIAGYGMHRPRSDNSTPEGKRLNRRVEILILTQ